MRIEFSFYENEVQRMFKEECSFYENRMKIFYENRINIFLFFWPTFKIENAMEYIVPPSQPAWH